MRLHQCFSLWFLLGFGYLGITLYANGKSIGALALDGRVTFAPDVELRIGTNHQLGKELPKVRNSASATSTGSKTRT